MARPVLAFWLLLAISGELASAAQRQDCSSKPGGVGVAPVTPDVRNLQKRVTAGLFYKELLYRFGKPLSCNLELDAGKVELTYSFRDSARLMAQINHEIEFSEQALRIPGMESRKAFALLKAAERDIYRPGGCGILWEHPKTSPGSTVGTREVTYSGGTCNCQAQVTLRKRYAVALLLRSAC